MLAAPDVDYLIAGTVFPTSSKPGLRERLGVGRARRDRPGRRGAGARDRRRAMDRIEAVARPAPPAWRRSGCSTRTARRARRRRVREARRRFDSARSAS